MITTATAPASTGRQPDPLCWPANDRAPAAARHAVRRYLAMLGEPGAVIVADAEVIVSELVTNAVRAYERAPGYQPGRPGHGELSLETWHGALLIEVTDRAPGLPDWEREPDYISESGRGLYAIKHLTDGHCGHYRIRSTGKCVWAALSLPDTADTSAYLDEPAAAVTGLRRTA